MSPQENLLFSSLGGQLVLYKRLYHFFVVLYKGAPYDGSKGVRSAFLAPSFNYVSGIHKALDIFWAISHLTLSLFIYFPLRFLLFRTSVPNENSYTSLQKMA